ncbi:MAG: hypothetical protein HY725_00390 [Candidatus Rokubacteria bacterium]|nr:hypothetical protein [Candidatus Rokubacteria bacterium]
MPTGVAVGVDLGGTRIRLVASGDAAHRRWSRTVAARAPTLADLPEFLARLWRRWEVRRRDVEALVVATRGIWTAGERRAQERRLLGLARRVRVISDVEAAFRGALGEGPGLLVLAGTGSIVLGRNRRARYARAGGLGPLLSDEGSAFWIGREWLRAATRGQAVARAREIGRAPDAVSRIAALAPTVLRRAKRGHGGARAIVGAAQEHLATFARDVARDLHLPAPVRVSWAGSLMENRAFRGGVWRSLRRQGVAARIVAPAEPPVIAAHAMASRLARGLRP